MSTSASVETYVRRLRRVEAQPRAHAPRWLPLLPFREWMQPVRDQQGRERRVLVQHQDWMPPWPRMVVLIDTAEDAGHGILRDRGRTLPELNREMAEMLCSGPEGVEFMWRLIDEAGDGG